MSQPWTTRSARIKQVPLLCAVVGMVGSLSPAWGAGFAITTQGAAGMAQSSAFSAQADDPSAVYYNPAGITQLRNLALLAGTVAIRPHAEFHPTGSGNPANERDRYYVLPHLFLTQPLGDRVTAGLGVFTPFGLATKWPAGWDGRFQVVDASIQVAMINPVVAWRPQPSIMVAAGIQYADLRLTERRAINLSTVVPGAPEGAVSLAGDARAVGYNAGVLVAPSSRWQVGASFRSRLNAEIKHGWADFSVPAPFVGSFPDGRIRTEVTLPASLRAGVQVRPVPELTIEADAAWTRWSSIDHLDIQFAGGLPMPVERTAFDWHDTTTYSLGVEYQVSQTLRLRGGGLYDPSPIPDARATPLIPDADRRGLTMGVGAAWGRWTVDAAYEYLVSERLKANALGSTSSSIVPLIDARANGRYRSHAHVVGLSVGSGF